MGLAAIAALLAAHGQCGASCRPLAAAIHQAADAHQLDPLLLVAVTLHESRARDRIAVRRYGWDVGPFQLRCPQTRRGCAVACRKRFAGDIRGQAMRAAKILAWGRRDCQAGARRWYCRSGQWFARYNPGSRRWADSVQRLWARLRMAEPVG